jgi:hypothetical protein
MAVNMLILVFWIVTLYGLVGGYDLEGQHLRLHHCESLKFNLRTLHWTRLLTSCSYLVFKIVLPCSRLITYWMYSIRVQGMPDVQLWFMNLVPEVLTISLLMTIGTILSQCNSREMLCLVECFFVAGCHHNEKVSPAVLYPEKEISRTVYVFIF